MLWRAGFLRVSAPILVIMLAALSVAGGVGRSVAAPACRIAGVNLASKTLEEGSHHCTAEDYAVTCDHAVTKHQAGFDADCKKACEPYVKKRERPLEEPAVKCAANPVEVTIDA
ncbi:MAG TPA: hypothetical protein VKQ54_07250, partial [Caulobacteraceae bacterium]|nr:hypothetical protein [Caulobacteraceae bacterium]